MLHEPQPAINFLISHCFLNALSTFLSQSLVQSGTALCYGSHLGHLHDFAIKYTVLFQGTNCFVYPFSCLVLICSLWQYLAALLCTASCY